MGRNWDWDVVWNILWLIHRSVDILWSFDRNVLRLFYRDRIRDRVVLWNWFWYGVVVVLRFASADTTDDEIWKGTFWLAT